MEATETRTLELLKPSEVAAELKVKKQQVYWYIRRGDLPATRLPGSRLLRVTREDLNRFIAAGFNKAD